jgi:hypothetical protein
MLPLATVQAAARRRREGRHDVSFQRLADDDMPWAKVLPTKACVLVEGDPGAAEVKQGVVDLGRCNDELRTLSQDAGAADGQHRRPVPIQSFPADEAIQEPLRAAREFEDDEKRHGRPRRKAPTLNRNGYGF